MTRSLIVLAILSIVVAVWTTQAAYVLNVVQGLHTYIDKILSIKLGGYSLNANMREAVTLIVVPLIAALLGRLLLWLIKKPSVFFVHAVLWVVWLMLATVLMINA